MKFNAKMAKDIADCYNEIDDNWDSIIPTLFGYARGGRYEYSTSYDSFGKHKYKNIVKHKTTLESLGFEVKIDEDMKTAFISWQRKE